MHSKTLRAYLLGLSLLTTCCCAVAEAYPDKGVFLKVAYPAGGPTDAYARKLQVPLQAAMGQTVIVENLPGAGGALAAQAVLRLPQDGYSLLGTSGADVILTPLTNAASRYKPDDLRLVAQFFSGDMVLLVRPSMPVKTVDEFIEYAKTRELTFATWGYGSSPHLLAAEFGRLAGIKVLDVPYKGAAPVVPDLASGQVDAAFYTLFGSTIGLIESGKFKAIGVASKTRNPNYPNIPTLNEGRVIKDFSASTWSGMFVKSGTPDNVVNKLNAATYTAIGTPDFQAYLKETGAAKFEAMNPDQAANFYKSELSKYTEMANRLNIKPQ